MFCLWKKNPSFSLVERVSLWSGSCNVAQSRTAQLDCWWIHFLVRQLSEMNIDILRRPSVCFPVSCQDMWFLTTPIIHPEIPLIPELYLEVFITKANGIDKRYEISQYIIHYQKPHMQLFQLMYRESLKWWQIFIISTSFFSCFLLLKNRPSSILIL